MRSLVVVLALLAPLAAAQSPAAPQAMQPIAGSPPPAAVPAAPAAAAPVPVAMSKPASPVRHWKKADARVCLEFPNDMQIIKCSENYR